MTNAIRRLGFAVVLAACGADATAPEDIGPTVASIDIQPNLGGAPIGAVVPLAIVGVDSAGRQISRPLSATWSSSNAQSFEIDGGGRLTVRASGAAIIRATLSERGRTLTDSIVVSTVFAAATHR